jgi:15-cis-phytoene synthase
MDASSLSYCRDKAAPVGSDLHYALLMAAPAQRAPLLAVWALWTELSSIPISVNDAGVALQKLGWWREELRRVTDNGGAHPVSRLLRAGGLPGQRFGDDAEALVAAVEEEIHYHAYPDEPALLAHAHRSGAPLGRLLARASAPDPAAVDDYTHQLAIALRLQQLLVRSRESIRLGRCHLPEDALRAAGLERDALQAGRTEPALAGVFAQAAARIETLLARADESLPVAHWQTQRPNRVVAALHRALLTELRESGFTLLEQRVELTPLRRLWIAWRVARARPRSS